MKAGQSVKKGDAVATLTQASVNAAVQSAQITYDDAMTKLKQAQSAQATGSVQAKTAYNTSKAAAANAQTTYNDTINSLNDAITSATTSYNSVVGTINFYNNEMASLLADKTAKDADAAANPGDTTKEAAAQAADKAYNDAQSGLGSANTQLTSVTNKLQAAKDALTSGKVNAEAQRENSIATGSNASTIYSNMLASLQSAVDSAQTSVTTAKTSLDALTPYQTDPTIYATIDGLIDSVSVSVGDTINGSSSNSNSTTTSQATIVTIADKSIANVIVSVTQDDIASITVGQAVSTALTSFTTPFEGTVDSITITPARSASSTVSYSVTIKLSGDVSKVYDGMTGNVTFVTKQVKNVLYVSNKAVTTENGKSYVNLKDSSGKTVKTQVTTGFSDGTNVEIQSGLKEGETVVISSTSTSTGSSNSNSQAVSSK